MRMRARIHTVVTQNDSLALAGIGGLRVSDHVIKIKCDRHRSIAFLQVDEWVHLCVSKQEGLD